jgi:general nucleoside transport system ATP-binding protein
MAAAPALQLVRIRKSFGDFLALDDACFDLRRGEVHALLGENGAGKSTLMSIAAGLYAANSGTILIDGRPIRLAAPRDARAHRIGMVHQHFKLIGPFTVAENILLANPSARFRQGIRRIAQAIRDKAAQIGFTIDPAQRIDDLSVAEQQRVEILKILIGGADILILDEPTAVLTDQEATGLLTTVRRMTAHGTAVVLVTHKLRDVIAYADRATVMRGGRTLATVDPRATTVDHLTALAVGEEIAAPSRSPSAASPARARLYVADLTCARRDGHVMVRGATFSVRAREIYGIAGVSGNGQTELVEALTGIRPPLAGTIEIAGAGDVTRATPRQRRDIGTAVIPADRSVYGLAGALSIVDNLAASGVRSGRYGRWWRTDGAAMRRDARAAVGAFDIQGVRTLAQKAALLSGGNAQKLVLARELGRTPAVIIAHSPSRGLDARACAAVHARLLAARDTGAAILLISDDLDEILSLSDRVGVMARGRIVAEFDAPADRRSVGRAMVHHA